MMDQIAGLLPGIGRSLTELYKVPLALAGAALALLWVRLSPARRRQALAVLAIVGSLNYMRWGTESTFGRVDTYDLLHYYVNSKFFPELGYFDLYPCLILADHENGGPKFEEPPTFTAQDETGHHREPIAEALVRGKQVRDEKFTPERWRSFEHDALYLARDLPGFDRDTTLWAEMINDHGFNGTTAWLALAAPISSAVPVEYVKELGFLDVGLLAVGLGAVGWAYGVDGALWALFFLTITYSARWPTVTWAFLRYDWVAAFLLAMALLKKERHFLAGLFAGWAATLRMFPAVWMWGPFAKGVVGLLKRQVSRPLLLLAAGFLVGVAALEGAAIARYGADEIRIHFENMEDHNSPEQLSSRRIGLAFGLSYDGALEPKMITEPRKELIDRQVPLKIAVGVGFLVVVGAAMGKLRDDEAYGYGFLAFFLLTTASYYYYVARITLVVGHTGDLARWRDRAGLAMLLVLEAFSNAAEFYRPGYRMFLIGWLSWGLMVYALAMGAWLLIDSPSGKLKPVAKVKRSTA